MANWRLINEHVRMQPCKPPLVSWAAPNTQWYKIRWMPAPTKTCGKWKWRWIRSIASKAKATGTTTWSGCNCWISIPMVAPAGSRPLWPPKATLPGDPVNKLLSTRLIRWPKSYKLAWPRFSPRSTSSLFWAKLGQLIQSGM